MYRKIDREKSIPDMFLFSYQDLLFNILDKNKSEIKNL